MSDSFTICSSRSLSVMAVDLCPTMDLIVILSVQGGLTVYRTLSWEVVLRKSSSELTGSGTSIPGSVSFCSSGKSIAIGSNEGDLLVLDIATSEVLSTYRHPSKTFRSAVVQVKWVQYVDQPSNYDSECQLTGRLHTWRQGGINLVDRSGMEEHLESGLGEISESHIVESFFRSTESSIMISLDANRELSGFIFGVYPLFSINLSMVESIVGGALNLTGIFFVSSLAEQLQEMAANEMMPTRSVQKLNIPMLSCSNCRFRWIEHAASLHLMIHADISKLQDMIANHSRKWKDSTRVIIPKLSLLQGVLDGYQIPMTPVQFMYTIAHCGLWHPAALTSFSQHWNDQGIARLRSAVDATSLTIIKSLQMRAVSIATNIALRCRESLGVQLALEACQGNEERPFTSTSTSITRKRAFEESTIILRNLVRSSELLLFKLDDALQEARAAQEGMAVYIQFIKDCSAQAAAQSAPSALPSKGFSVTTPKYMRIFDPRSIRAMGKGPQAEAEVVTGTHLYAYLQDLELPAALVKSRGNRSSGSRRGSDDNRRNATHKMFCTAERFAAGEGSGANSPAPETNSTYEIEYQESSKRSLLQEIKVMKDAFLRAFYNIHDRISSDMSIDCHTDPLRLDSLSEEPLLPSNHTIFEGTSLISGINQTQRSSIICSDDMLVTDFKIVVRDQSFCTDIGGRSSSDSEAAESSRCKNITLDTALLSALIVSDSGIRNSHLGSEEFAEETLDLLVMCRSNPNIINNNNKSNYKNNNDNSRNNKCNIRSDDDLQTLYCARVRLSSADGVGIFRSALGGKDGVQKVKLYVVPVLPQQSAPNRFPECCSDDGNREEYEDDNCSVAEVNSYDSSVDDEINQRVAAIVGLGTVDQNETDACSGPRTCLFQIDVKDLRFFAINQSDSISDRSIQTSSSEKYVRTALAASTINSDILLAMQLQYIGDGENEVRFRRRLLSMDLPEDRDALLFEACAARGVVIVGNTSMAGSLGGKVTVVDMVVDEDEDEDEDDSNADDSDHDIDLQNSQLEIAETFNDSCITMTE